MNVVLVEPHFVVQSLDARVNLGYPLPRMKRDPLIEILKSELARKKVRNRGYSLRFYSRYLEVDASNLSKILAYRKSLGPALKKRLARKIGLTDQDLENLDVTDSGNGQIADGDYRSHSAETFAVVSGWQHYAILELFKMHDFKPYTAAIATRLGISKKVAAESLARLKSVGLLRAKPDGTLIPVDESSSSTLSGPTSKAHRDQQREILEGAIEALIDVPIERRSQSSMTMAIDTENLEEAKRLIKKFRRQMGRLLSQSDRLDAVYQLSISLYPVTIETNRNSQNTNKETL